MIRVKQLFCVTLMCIETLAEKCTTALCSVCAGIIPLNVLLQMSFGTIITVLCFSIIMLFLAAVLLGLRVWSGSHVCYHAGVGTFILIYNYPSRPTSSVQHSQNFLWYSLSLPKYLVKVVLESFEEQIKSIMLILVPGNNRHLEQENGRARGKNDKE